MIFGETERERFDKETKCLICKREFNDDVKNYKDRDHSILLAGIEELHTNYVILSIENLILHLWCFITLVAMIATYS